MQSIENRDPLLFRASVIVPAALAVQSALVSVVLVVVILIVEPAVKDRNARTTLLANLKKPANFSLVVMWISNIGYNISMSLYNNSFRQSLTTLSICLLFINLCEAGYVWFSWSRARDILQGKVSSATSPVISPRISAIVRFIAQWFALSAAVLTIVLLGLEHIPAIKDNYALFIKLHMTGAFLNGCFMFIMDSYFARVFVTHIYSLEKDMTGVIQAVSPKLVNCGGVETSSNNGLRVSLFRSSPSPDARRLQIIARFGFAATCCAFTTLGVFCTATVSLFLDPTLESFRAVELMYDVTWILKDIFLNLTGCICVAMKVALIQLRRTSTRAAVNNRKTLDASDAAWIIHRVESRLGEDNGRLKPIVE